MGKNLIQQARGTGSPTYRAPSFRYKGEAKHHPYTKETVQGTIIDILHCQGHSAPLAKVQYDDGESVLLLAPEGIKVGDTVTSGAEAEAKAGNTLPLAQIPEGTLIYNIEGVPGDGGKFVRASGTFAKIVTKLKDGIVIQLPSKKSKQFNANCRASIGVVAGGGRLEKPFLKAGQAYFKHWAKNKKYPHIGGSSQNAVDHPFGNKRSLRKSKARPTSRNAPPGRKVGMIAARRTGRKTK
jgi:large subunit ribosomal protein L2